MKQTNFIKLVFVSMLIAAASLNLVAQNQLREEVYLKNGSILNGIISEQVSEQSFLTQTNDGCILDYQMNDVEKITREAPFLQATGSSPLPKTAFYFNPLGFLQFGPVIGGEFRIAENLLLDAHLRYTPLGIAYQAIVTDGFEDRASFAALSLGPGIKYLFPNSNSPNRFYIAGYLESGFGGSSGDFNSSYEWEGRFTYIVPIFNFGYRWANPRKGTYIGLGVFAGVASRFSDKWWYINDPDDVRNDPGTDPFGMLELSFGFTSKQ